MRNRELDKQVLATLRDYYLCAAGDLALYPEEAPEHRRAEAWAMDTSRTVFELFGADTVEELRQEAFKKWPKLKKDA